MTRAMKPGPSIGAPQPIPQVIYNPDLNATLGGIADHLIFQSAMAHFERHAVEAEPAKEQFLRSLNLVLECLEAHQDRIPEWVGEQRAKLAAEQAEREAAIAAEEEGDEEPARG